MHKTYEWKYVRLQKKRARKRLKRIRKKPYYKVKFSTEYKVREFRRRIDIRKLSNYKFELHTFLEERGNPPLAALTTEISIPSDFSLESNHNETIGTLSLIRKSLLKFLGQKFTIDFSKCKSADFSGLFLLKVILEEYLKEFRKLEKELMFYKAVPEITIKLSNIEEVNLKLLANAIVNNAQVKKTEFIPISILNMITGRKTQKHYAENKKGLAATSIRNYINMGLRRQGFELKPKGGGLLDGMISEILNNAEDHSHFDRWYAFANLFETTKNSNTDSVGEINFAFLNFGYSIYEGFEGTRFENSKVYGEMDQMCSLVQKTKLGKKFTKENLFTLYALQDGNSRLTFNEESRGTGTMKFIKSFLDLGDYQDEKRKFHPHLIIYSGATMLQCDNLYRPFEIDGVNYLSLNRDNDMTKPPEKSHLKTLENRFPGTLLVGKIYLNKDHLNKKLKADGSKEN